MRTVALMDAMLYGEILILCMMGVMGMAMWRVSRG